MNKQIGQAAKWSSITEVVAKMITPVVNIFLAHILTPESFGIVATITMVISFAEVFTDAGFQKYIIQHEFESEKELDDSTNVAFWTNLGVSLFVCGIIFLFRDSIAKLVGNPELGNSISIASVLIIIASFSSIQIARYRRALDFKTLFFVRIVTTFVPIVITVPLAFLLKNYWAILIGNFTSQFCNALVLTVFSKWKPKFYYSIALLKKMFSFTVWTLLESVSIWLTLNIGVFIVGNNLSDYHLGLYKTSMATVNSYMGVITSALTPVVFSALSRYQNDEYNYKKTYYFFQRLTAVFVIPMGVGIYVYSDVITNVLLGNQWKEAAGFLGLWGLISSFTIVFSHFSSEVFRSKGDPKISLLMQAIHLFFLIPSLLISVSYGFTVMYITRSLIRIQIIITALLFMHYIYGFKVLQMLKNVYPMVFAAFVMGCFGCFCRVISHSVVWQVMSIFLCVVIYFFILFFFFPNIRLEVESTDVIKKIKRLLKKE